MKVGQPALTRFFVPSPGEEVVVNGTVEAISTVPRPGTVPYPDHILALHLTDLVVEGRSASEVLEALIYLESMRDNVLTAAARLRPGDRVKTAAPCLDRRVGSLRKNQSQRDRRSLYSIRRACVGRTDQQLTVVA